MSENMAYTKAWYAEQWDKAEHRIRELEIENAKLRDRPCIDCCCARAWAALGIVEYTGRSIPEHITDLNKRIAELEAELNELTATCQQCLKILRGNKIIHSTLGKELLEACTKARKAPAAPVRKDKMRRRNEKRRRTG